MHWENTMHYRELRLVDAQGKSETTIGDALEQAIRLIEMSEFSGVVFDADGSVSSWDDYFIAADGEEPDCATPGCDVEWSGFRESVELLQSSVEASQ